MPSFLKNSWQQILSWFWGGDQAGTDPIFVCVCLLFKSFIPSPGFVSTWCTIISIYFCQPQDWPWWPCLFGFLHGVLICSERTGRLRSGPHWVFSISKCHDWETGHPLPSSHWLGLQGQCWEELDSLGGVASKSTTGPSHFGFLS